MFDLPDPITNFVSLFVKKAAASRVGQRLELLLEMFIASQIAFMGTCGAALTVLRLSTAMSIGSGMIAASLALLGTFLGSSNSKGLFISIPQEIVKQEMSTQMSNFQRSPNK